MDKLILQLDATCSLITQLPSIPQEKGQHFPTPYLVLIDWGHDERDYKAGHPNEAKRLSSFDWNKMMTHIQILAERAESKFGVRCVIHPHAGGYIEFDDKIQQLLQDIPYETAGLCFDTGHLYYSKMNPEKWIRKYADRLDYIHFKDINLRIYQQVMGIRIRFFDACGMGVMCPIGQGVIDYHSIYRVLKEINYQGYITIEQERDPRNSGSSLRDVKQSISYLKNIAY